MIFCFKGISFSDVIIPPIIPFCIFSSKSPTKLRTMKDAVALIPFSTLSQLVRLSSRCFSLMFNSLTNFLLMAQQFAPESNKAYVLQDRPSTYTVTATMGLATVSFAYASRSH